jgi:hypothetical protein
VLGRRRRSTSSASEEEKDPSQSNVLGQESKRRRHNDIDMLGATDGNRISTADRAGKGPAISPKALGAGGNSSHTIMGDGSDSQGSKSTSNKRDATQSTFYGHDREEVTRILIQGLSDLGYESSAQSLSRESGYDLETPFASAFRLSVIEGDWAEAESLVVNAEGGYRDVLIDPRNSQPGGQAGVGRRALLLAADASIEQMLFEIREQKYLELLEKRDLGAALMVLRQELQPLQQDERHLHALSRYESSPGLLVSWFRSLYQL